MNAKNLHVSNLLDCYGALLTQKQQYLLDCYYNDDLSLSEIADNENITPQGARDIIKRAADKLESFEKKLGFAAYLERVSECATRIKELADANGNEEISKTAQELLK